MAAAKDNGPDACNNRPAKTPTKYTLDFIATCARCASSDAATASAAVLLAVEAIRLLVLGVVQ